ncbi:hypothetical protein BS78_05G155200 [Paspalum vaginatum]|nr:hypothetical protein BS78_05G155200 [Paspalum vaginatum]
MLTRPPACHSCANPYPRLEARKTDRDRRHRTCAPTRPAPLRPTRPRLRSPPPPARRIRGPPAQPSRRCRRCAHRRPFCLHHPAPPPGLCGPATRPPPRRHHLCPHIDQQPRGHRHVAAQAPAVAGAAAELPVRCPLCRSTAGHDPGLTCRV